MTQCSIQIDDLCKSFGPVKAVNGISFQVAQGEVLGFLGPNGAGKSTTMRMIVGYLRPSAGAVHICGHDAAKDPQTCRSLVGYLPEGAPAYPDMTPAEFLAFIADIRGLKGPQAEAAIARAARKADLDGVLHRPIDTLSKGFKRRVGLAQAILHDPPVLIMDEPTDGLDPNQKHAVRDLIREMSAEKTIIISTHILEEVEAVCSRAVIIDQGRLVADGTPAELAARSRFHNAVVVELAPDHVADARPIFQQSQDIAAVEESEAGGTVRFTLFPADKEMPLINSVGPALQESGWTVLALYAEQGRLDDVFRALTHSDTERADAEPADKGQAEAGGGGNTTPGARPDPSRTAEAPANAAQG